MKCIGFHVDGFYFCRVQVERSLTRAGFYSSLINIGLLFVILTRDNATTLHFFLNKHRLQNNFWSANKNKTTNLHKKLKFHERTHVTVAKNDFKRFVEAWEFPLWYKYSTDDEHLLFTNFSVSFLTSGDVWKVNGMWQLHHSKVIVIFCVGYLFLQKYINKR